MVMARKLSIAWVAFSVSLVSPIIMFLDASSASAQVMIAEIPLGEKIRQDQSTVREDRQIMQRDERRGQRAEQNAEQYIQSTQQWLQQNEAQMQANQAKLSQLESGIKAKSSLAKLLNTPGNQLYMLKTLLNTEEQQKEQALTNLQTAQQNLGAAKAAVEQDRYQLHSDISSVHHDQGSYRDEMDDHYDLVREKNEALYAGDRSYRMGNRRHFYTGFDQASYDAGRHRRGLGNPYWGLRSNNTGFEGQ